MQLTIYRNEFALNDSEIGEWEQVNETSTEVVFESAVEIADYLTQQCMTIPSSHPDFQVGVSWHDEPYDHPEDYRVERSAFRDEETISDEVWHEVWMRLTAEPADVVRLVVDRVVKRFVPGERRAGRPSPGDMPRLTSEIMLALRLDLPEGDLDDDAK